MRQTGLSLHQAQQRFLADQMRRNHSPATIAHYEQTFATLDTWLKASRRPYLVGTLTTSNLQAFSAWLEETPLERPYRGHTHRTITGIHGRMKDLRAFLFWLAEEGLVEKLPKFPMPKLPETDFVIFTDAELVTIFSSRHLMAAGPQAVRNRALIALLLDSGLRLAEVAGITLNELDLKDRIVRIHGKGRKDRPVPFSEGTVDYLRRWIRVRGGEAGSLFGLSRYGIRQLLTRIGQETGIHVHPHKFRHTAATMMVRENMDLHSIKRVLGHSHLSVTEKYLSLSTEDLKNKHNAASPLERVRSLMPATAARPKRRRLGLD